MEHKTKIYCASEDQQQFNLLTDRPIEISCSHKELRGNHQSIRTRVYIVVSRYQATIGEDIEVLGRPHINCVKTSIKT
jgi:hypothetical protein